ncbi:hypothetical protein ABBQ38_000076 [Trebouxia sp. C0009 RCD-2024]
MPLLQMLATVQEEQSLGHLQDLTSPVLGKLKEALIFTRLAMAQRRAFGSKTVVLTGSLNCQLHLGWFEEARLLVMAYKNPDCSGNADETERGPVRDHFLPQADTVTPQWLKAVAPEAAVNSNVLRIFDSLRDGDQCFAQVMQSVTGGVTPRRITSVGYCTGGSVASLAAVFAALQCPTADVRCITFGSQLVGNAAFGNAFRWLVGLSYRVVYRRDPIPSHKVRRLNLLNDTLTHVHGEIYIDDEQLAPGKQPAHSVRDVEDHSFMRYAEALHKICLAHFERDQAAGGNLYAKFARCYLQLAGKETSQPQPKQPGHPPMDTGQSDQASTKGDHISEVTRASPNGPASQPSPPQADSPFDFKSPVQGGHPNLNPPQSQQPSREAGQGAPQEDPEKQARCGRALLERAMLGPPLPEGDGAICSSDRAGATSSKTVQDSVHASIGPFLDGPNRDPNSAALASVIRGDIDTDQQATTQPQPAAGAAAAADGAVQPNTAWQQDASTAALGKDNSGDHSTVAAESISPRCSSQQSQGTNIDWEEAGEHGEVNSRAPHSELKAAPGLDAASPQPQGSTPATQPGTIEHHVANQTSEQYAEYLANVYQGKVHDDPAKDPKPQPPSEPQKLTSQSSQRARAMTDDVMGMAPNPASSMMGEEGAGGRRWLKRAFSMVDQENVGIDMNLQMDSLDKVLIVGKISQAVVIAAAAYRTEAEFKERTGIQKSKLIVDDTHTNTHVHVGWLEGGTAILAFRGTQTAQDGLQDVKIVRQSIDHLQGMFPGTQAHSGFLQQFAGVCRADEPEKNMATVLEQLSNGQTPTRVLCCGHSLGGALATLGATWAALQYPQADIRCITFGSPRVGNKAFKRAFHTLVGTSLRLVHGGDPVPVLPPAFVYHHVNGAIHIMGGKIKLRSRPWHFKLRPNVADHLVARYNAGIYLHMPGGLEAMPLPWPRNLRRLNSLASSVNDRSSKGSAMDRSSSGLNNLSPTTAAAAAAALDADDDGLPHVGGVSPYGAYGTVYNGAVQEAHDVADALHLSRRSDDRQTSEGFFGSFRRSKRHPGTAESASGGWTMWHMFGCVAMQKGVKDESSSDEDESVHPVHSRHSAPAVAGK